MIKCNFLLLFLNEVNRGLAGFSVLSSVFLSPQHCYWKDPFLWLQFVLILLLLLNCCYCGQNKLLNAVGS